MNEPNKGKSMFDMLYHKQPLIINTELACELGLNEAIFLQQLHYWLNAKSELQAKGEKQKSFKDGVMWNFNTIEEWIVQFPFWSKRTLARVMAPLEFAGILVVTDRYNYNNSCRTKWYTINYPLLKVIDKTYYENKKKEYATIEKSTKTKVEKRRLNSIVKSKYYDNFVKGINPAFYFPSEIATKNNALCQNDIMQSKGVLNGESRQTTLCQNGTVESAKMADSVNRDYLTETTIKNTDTKSDTNRVSKNEVESYLERLDNSLSDYEPKTFLTDRAKFNIKMWGEVKQQPQLSKKIQDLIFQTKRTAERKANLEKPIMLTLDNELTLDLERTIERTVRQLRAAEKAGKPVSNELGYWNHVLSNYWDMAVLCFTNFNLDFIPDGAEFANQRRSQLEAYELIEEQSIWAQPLDTQVRYFFRKWCEENGNPSFFSQNDRQNVGQAREEIETYILQGIQESDNEVTFSPIEFDEAFTNGVSWFWESNK